MCASPVLSVCAPLHVKSKNLSVIGVGGEVKHFFSSGKLLADVTDFFLVRDFRNRLQNESLMLVSQYKRGIFLELAILYFMGDAKFAQLLQ